MATTLEDLCLEERGGRNESPLRSGDCNPRPLSGPRPDIYSLAHSRDIPNNGSTSMLGEQSLCSKVSRPKGDTNRFELAIMNPSERSTPSLPGLPLFYCHHKNVAKTSHKGQPWINTNIIFFCIFLRYSTTLNDRPGYGYRTMLASSSSTILLPVSV